MGFLHYTHRLNESSCILNKTHTHTQVFLDQSIQGWKARNKVKQGHTTTPGTPCPTLCEKCAGSLTRLADKYREDAGDWAYGLSSLSEKTRTSNHLQMSLQRQHILLSYFKTLSVGPVWGFTTDRLIRV